MSCPDLMPLSQLLDGELDPADAAAVRSHVDDCAACRGRLERLEQAIDAGRAAMTEGRPLAPRRAPGARCLAPDQLAGWAAGALPPGDLGVVEAHLEGCDACVDEAIGMVRLMTRLDAGPTLAVPPALGARVASRWDAAPPDASLTALVIRVARAGMELIERHVVAPVMDVEELALAAPAVRARTKAQAAGFRIRAAEAEILATVVPEGAAVGLTLTLLGNGEEALPGQRVFLRRHGRSIFSARTDAAGELRMPRMDPGVYEVSCPGIGTTFRLDLRP
jgi:anti-sigma factor RsiW